MSHPSVIRAGYEPIPGYVLRQRLGAGGYGEVWSADAPGGLKKAVKLVYGTLDEQRASSELRSLQRIRQVHHPLLLSLERIEIVNGQLIIVTELAESSLTDCFHAARRRQLQGIPRDQLLDYLRDAGDALDYLSQKHDLQHLDVKPGNLLLMADRIKVADFGLIKDLHDPNVSIVSGLTPTHAAPELFDGRPDRLSDLYSLAIVYQEMLTGKLPFDGKTAGELARQHLHQAPNLEPLPPADRRVVARALAKHPLDRFNSCRAFVEELRNSGTREKYASMVRMNDAEHDRNDSRTDSRSEQKPEVCVDAQSTDANKGTSTCTSPALLGGLQVMSPLPTADSAEGWHAPLCMFIGLGGVGCTALSRLRNILDQKVDNRRRASDHQWLALDTDFDLLSEVSNTRQPGGLDYRNICHLRLFRPQDYRERTDDRFAVISRRWMYNIPRSLKTEGVRPLAMLALVDHLEEVEQRLYNQLKALLANRQSLEGDDPQPIRIYLCGSLHGGTGSAIMSEVGRILRRTLAQLNCSDYFLIANASIAMTTGTSHSLPAAAALATLCEIDAQMEGSNFIPPIGRLNAMAPTGSSRPFDWLTLVDGGMHGISEDVEATVDALAEMLWVDSHTLIGPTLDSARHPQGPHHASKSRSWLRAARCSLVQLGLNLQPAQLARICCAQSIARWYSCVASGDSTNSTDVGTSQTLGWSQTQTATIVEHLSADLMRGLRLSIDAEAGPDALSSANSTRNRTLSNPEAIRLQLERDLRVCRDWVASHIRPSYISWKMLKRIALRSVERLLELAKSPDDHLQKISAGGKAESRLSIEELTNLRNYISLLSERFMQQLQAIQPQMEKFTVSLSQWSASLHAEHKMQTDSNNIPLEDLHVPVGWRHMLQRVHSILDSTLQRYVVSRCFNSFVADSSAKEAVAGVLTLEHLLRLSDDMVNRLMREAGMTPNVAPLSDTSTSTRSIVLQDVDSLVPPAAQRGGKMYRLLAVAAAQLNDVQPRLAQLEMTESCTLVPAQFGEEPVAVCDANELNVSGLISSFWRPNADTFRMAERLHSRCDVAWQSADALLACEMAQ